jgi:hypothetical protein
MDSRVEQSSAGQAADGVPVRVVGEVKVPLADWVGAFHLHRHGRTPSGSPSVAEIEWESVRHPELQAVSVRQEFGTMGDWMRLNLVSSKKWRGRTFLALSLQAGTSGVSSSLKGGHPFMRLAFLPSVAALLGHLERGQILAAGVDRR